ncbi:MAG: uroporphyrinogen decarboxylase family protein [Coprobacillaceae bacterium]
MKEWLTKIRSKNNKKAMPILTFPATQLLNISVKEFIKNSDLQVQAMKLVVERCDPLASLGLMDLSVEAECFGSKRHFSDNEVPTVIGSIVNNEEEAQSLMIPKVGDKRTGIYIEAIKKAKEEIKDRPVLAGCIGPFSLAGRLMDVSEAMIYCYDDPDMVHTVLSKVTDFLISYILAYKDVGADGVVLAEPLAGILSPALCDEFSSVYVKKIVEAVDDNNFSVIYHNCGNNTLKMVETITSTGCEAYHFGNAIDMAEMLKLMPKDKIIMGNINPVDFKDSSTEEIIHNTKELLKTIGEQENFIISSGCDIPPTSSWDNIDAFMQISNTYYRTE